jgi:hypothetical protein
MGNVVRTLMFGRNGGKSGSRSHSPASQTAIAALSILCLSSVLSYSAGAQALPQGRAGQSHTQPSISPETMALHALAKRLPAQANTLDPAASIAAASATFNSDQGPGPDPIGLGPGCNLFLAHPSVDATVPLSYFGPPPSDVNRSFVGPVQQLHTSQTDRH